MKEFLAAITLMVVLLVGGTWGYRAWDHSRTIRSVEQAVLGELVSPATAKFSGAAIEKIRNGRVTFLRITGAVDSQNRSGGLVRSEFEAKIFEPGKIEDLKITER